MTNGNQVTSSVGDLVAYCTAETRICPQPTVWHELWQKLTVSARDRRTTGYDIAISVDDDERSYRLRFEPPHPNILGSWWATSDVHKMETLRQQILWAAQHNVLDVADGFLRGLSGDAWHCRANPSTWTMNEIMEHDWRMQVEEERARRAESRARRLAKAQAHRGRKPAIDRRYASSLNEGLLQAYRATAYVVFAETEFALRIGERSAALAELFDCTGNCCAAYITACNPKGAARDPAFNTAAQERLTALAAELGLEYLKGEGRGEIGDWPPEESLLILGCTRSRAKKLGHAFKQNAVVWVGADAIPELIMLMPLGILQSGPSDAALCMANSSPPRPA